MKTASRLAVLAVILALPTVALAAIEADSISDFSASGTQGENGWWYGYYNQSADGDATYAASDFQLFEGPDWVWNAGASKWDWGGGNVPWTEISAPGGHPNGDNNGDVHFAVRRWESDVAGDATVSFNLAASNTNGGNGTTAIVYHNGAELGSIVVDGTDGVGLTDTVTASLAVGDYLDLALSPQGTDGSFHDGSDGSFFGMTVDVSAAFAGVNVNFWSRPRSRRRYLSLSLPDTSATTVRHTATVGTDGHTDGSTGRMPRTSNPKIEIATTAIHPMNDGIRSINMIKGDSHRWQIDIPNGTYNVRLVGGDPNHTDQTSDFEISGGDTPHMLADPDGPGNNWDEFNFTYTVTNGFLRVTPNPDGDLSKNQKLSFIDISPVPEPTMFGLASLAALALLGLRRRR